MDVQYAFGVLRICRVYMVPYVHERDLLLTLFCSGSTNVTEVFFCLRVLQYVWFTLEDVVWFVYNGVTYGSALGSPTRWISILCLWCRSSSSLYGV